MHQLKFDHIKSQLQSLILNLDSVLPICSKKKRHLIWVFPDINCIDSLVKQKDLILFNFPLSQYFVTVLVPKHPKLGWVIDEVRHLLIGDEILEVDYEALFATVNWGASESFFLEFNNRIFGFFKKRIALLAGETCSFAMYCKTYSVDIDRFKVMLDSFAQHNKDNIKLYVSVPAHELNLYSEIESKINNVVVISDESFAEPYLATIGHWGMSIGYANQEICKLTFFKTGFAENYLTIDSDAYFIRDFFVSDFMFDTNKPYTVLVMDKDLSCERHYRDTHWIGRQESIKRIYQSVGLNDRRLRTCHGMQVMNTRVLMSLQDDFMTPLKLTYNDLLGIAPYEFTWYNAWFQKSKLVEEYAVEPFFKTLHMRPEYVFSRLRLLREEDLSYAYVGIVMNSKWHPKTPLRYEEPTPIYYGFYEKIIRNDDILSEF